MIREFLQQFPKAGWDSIVGAQTTEKLKLAIKLYFYFVQQRVPKLNFYQHANENLFIICYTDASKDLLTYRSRWKTMVKVKPYSELNRKAQKEP